MSDLLPSTLPLDQQLAILRDALDQIAHWGDDFGDDLVSAVRARGALRKAGYYHVPAFVCAALRRASLGIPAGDADVAVVRDAAQRDSRITSTPEFIRWFLVNSDRFNPHG